MFTLLPTPTPGFFHPHLVLTGQSFLCTTFMWGSGVYGT